MIRSRLFVAWHRQRLSRGLLVLAILFVTAQVGCGGHAPPAQKPAASKAPQVPALCFLNTEMGRDQPPETRTFQPGYWFALLVGGYSESGDYTRPPRDCKDAVTRLDRDGCDWESVLEVAPGRLLTPSDLVVTKIDGTRRLVWAMTDHLSDGEAQGPVALADLRPHGIAVIAMGVLRAYPRNVALRLERFGANSVLVADGESCDDARESSEECARAVRLLPLVGDRFLPRALVDTNGVCLGRALIPVRGSGTNVADHHAQYRVETLVTFSPDAIVIREQLAIDRQPPHSNAAKESYVTRMQVDRQVTLNGGNLIASGPSLLTRWLARKGKDF